MIRNLAAAVQGFTSNAFLVTGERTVLVDAGNSFDVASAVREHADGLDALVLTHTHSDHVGNLSDVVEGFGVDVWGYDTDQEGVTRLLSEDEPVRLGDDSYEVIHTPGHKDDHVCLYASGPGVLFAGDLVFANGGFGRTDLAEGNRELLIDSIQRLLERVERLEEMHTGHGPSVEHNPRQDIELALQAAQMR
jgi:glyoxylase-like metal-dependent hydrolase (beta-lactamase superfamily II)